jgi:CHASE3 domain sensor protein
MNPTRNASTPAARLALAPVAAAGAPAGTASALVFALGVLAVALGALVVLTWAVRLPASDVAGIVKVPMRVNAGIGFLVDGLALLLLPFRGTARTIVLPVVGLFNLAAALLALAAYFLGGDSPLAAWPLGPLRGAVLGAQAGALAPPSAVAFVLIGLAFTLVGGTRPRSAGVPVLLALGSTLVAMAALALGGHLARSAFGVDWWNVAGMGVPTAAGTLLIGGALIAWTRHAFAVRWSLDATTTSAFLLGIVAIVLIASASYDFTARLERDTAQVSRTEEVLKEIEEVTTAQRDLSLNLGRYLIARDASLLADRPRIEAAIAAGIGRIRALAGAEAEKLRMLDDLVALTAQRIAKSDDIIARARADDPSAARIESLIGKDYQAVGSAIDRLLQAMRAAEYAALQQRIARADATSGKTFLLLPIGVFGSPRSSGSGSSSSTAAPPSAGASSRRAGVSRQSSSPPTTRSSASIATRRSRRGTAAPSGCSVMRPPTRSASRWRCSCRPTTSTPRRRCSRASARATTWSRTRRAA